jgi:hypothetical protein
MFRRRKVEWLVPGRFRRWLPFACAALFVSISGYACKSSHTSDFRLKKIDEMLNAQLPPGTMRTRVEYFLSSRGYRTQRAPGTSSLLALVRHVDPGTLEPATARVTFHFDSNDKLVSYELQYTPDAPLGLDSPRTSP